MRWAGLPTRDGRSAHLPTAIRNSTYVVTAWHADQLVGLARGLSDDVSIFYLQDILVHPDYQRTGIGEACCKTASTAFTMCAQNCCLPTTTKSKSILPLARFHQYQFTAQNTHQHLRADEQHHARIGKIKLTLRRPKPMLTASCHCGAVQIEVDHTPPSLTQCTCSICRRYAALWAYYTRKTARVHAATGATTIYM